MLSFTKTNLELLYRTELGGDRDSSGELTRALILRIIMSCVCNTSWCCVLTERLPSLCILRYTRLAGLVSLVSFWAWCSVRLFLPAQSCLTLSDHLDCSLPGSSFSKGAYFQVSALPRLNLSAAVNRAKAGNVAKRSHTEVEVLKIDLYLKWLTNKDLPHSTGNSAQCYVTAWRGGVFGGE